MTANQIFSKCAICITVLLMTAQVYAQNEVILDLDANPVLKVAHSNISKYVVSSQSKINTDTIGLPVIDDFSSGGVFPAQQIWTDSFAFINSTYPIDPVTVGVATLDGIDQFGNPYDNSNPNTYGLADFLSSKPIDLKYPVSDSLYLSFFYQPQGAGNAPEGSDSLVLEFTAPGLGWNWVWSVPGKTNHEFKQIMIPIVDTIYLQRGFRFRFKNYATLSGNVDHWHIDYIRLNRLRTAQDTALDDVAFIDAPPTPLKTFENMPWRHFLVNPANYMKSMVVLRVRNRSNGARLVSFRDTIRDQSGMPVFNTNATFWNINANTIFTDTVRYGTFIFPSQAGDSALFTIKHSLNTTPDVNRGNDTLRRDQKFYNYYAYDDGTAENGYGLNVINGKIAYRFDLAMTDTLRAIQMYFNQINTNVSGKLFKLTVWSSLSPETIIYQKADQRPAYTDSINGYHTYWIKDTTLIVSGSVYIGWVQATAELLNIGLDRNTSNTDKMFYNSSGTWYNSLVNGSWMIRPVFGELPLLAGVKNVQSNNSGVVEIFPNPATERIFVKINDPKSDKYKTDFFDLTGRLVRRKLVEADGSVDVSELIPGFYHVRISGRNENVSYYSKILIIR